MNLGVQRMEVKILASDLDGTLLDQNSRISEKTAKAIKEAQNAGIHFIAVTGRSWETAHQIFQEAGIEVDYILLNGAEFRISSGEKTKDIEALCFFERSHSHEEYKKSFQ